MTRFAFAAAFALVAAQAAAQTPMLPGARPSGPIGRVALAPGDVVGEFDASDLEGAPVKLSWGGAKLTLVNLWATWCVPCRDEMPGLEKIHAAHPDSDLRFVGVVVLDRAPYADIKAAVAASKVTYRVIVDSRKAAQHAFGGVATVPTTFLLDAQGKIVRKFVGTSAKQLEALSKDIDDALAGRPLGAPYLPPPEEPPAATR